MTFVIWTEATKRVIQRSAFWTANPTKGGFPNLRVIFHEEEEPDNSPQIVEPKDRLDKSWFDVSTSKTHRNKNQET